MLSLWSPFEDLMNDDYWPSRRSVAERAHAPAVDVREETNAYVIEAELPGFKPEDVEIHVDGGVMTLSAERKFERKEERKGYQRLERRYGTFRRSFTLPESVDAEHVDASLREGILTVAIPKREAAVPRKITVKGESLVEKAKKVLTGEGSERAA